MRTKLGLILVSSLVILPQAAMAASGHGAGHEASFWDIKFFLINFAIYAAFLLFIGIKKMPPLWTARRNNLERAINSSRLKTEAIEKSITEAKNKIAALPTEIKSIQERIADEAKREVAEIESSTKLAIERMNQQLKDRLAAEEKSMETLMRRSYTERAIKIAEEKLKAKLNQETDRAYRESTLKNMKALVQ